MTESESETREKLKKGAENFVVSLIAYPFILPAMLLPAIFINSG